MDDGRLIVFYEALIEVVTVWGHWFWHHAIVILPELIGGFVAYFMHQLYHELFRKPGRTLLRIVLRRRL